MLTIEVQCNSEYTYAQKPVSFIWEGKIQENLTIRKSWKSPLGPVFEVQTEDQRVIRLRFLENENCWQGQEIVAR
jgi:hypothetical protein